MGGVRSIGHRRAASVKQLQENPLSTYQQASIRAFVSDDLFRVAGFLRRINRIDSRVDGPEDEAFAAFTRLSSNQGGRWFAIAEVGSEIVAVLLSGRYRVEDRSQTVCAFRVFVAPEHRGHGLGRALLAYLESQHADGDFIFRTVISGDWPAGRGLLEHRGFERPSVDFRRTALPPEMPAPPKGLIRDADLARDGEFIADLYNGAIAGRRIRAGLGRDQHRWVPGGASSYWSRAR